MLVGTSSAQHAAHAVHKKERKACQEPKTGPRRLSQKVERKPTTPQAPKAPNCNCVPFVKRALSGPLNGRFTFTQIWSKFDVFWRKTHVLVRIGRMPRSQTLAPLLFCVIQRKSHLKRTHHGQTVPITAILLSRHCCTMAGRELCAQRAHSEQYAHVAPLLHAIHPPLENQRNRQTPTAFQGLVSELLCLLGEMSPKIQSEWSPTLSTNMPSRLVRLSKGIQAVYCTRRTCPCLLARRTKWIILTSFLQLHAT